MASIINAATSGGLVTTADTSGILQLQTAGTTAVTVNASQNVGIGTDAPTQALDVQKSQGWITTTSTTGTLSSLFKSSNTGGSSYFGRDNSTGGVLGSAAYATVVYGSGAYPMTFHTNDTERMRIDSSGNVGIGTSSPASKLEVVGIGRFNGLSVDGTSTYNGQITLGSAAGAQGVIHYDGNIASAPLYIDNTYDDNRALMKFRMRTSGTPVTALTVDAAGTLQAVSTISVGNATPSSSGAGITFPATQSASSDANTLDDYEEGTWSPVLTTSGTGFSGVTNSSTGQYTKIGRSVSVCFEAGLSGTASSGTGQVLITGLPFTTQSGSSQGVGYGCPQVGKITLSLDPLYVRTSSSSTELTIYALVSNANATAIDASAVNGRNSSYIGTSLTYFV